MAIRIEIIDPKPVTTDINFDCVDDVFDMIVDATLAGQVLARNIIEDVCSLMYRDKRGGPLVELWWSDEFDTALEWQYAMGVRG